MRKPGLLPIFLTVVIDLLGFGIVLPMLPLYADEWKASPTVIALLFTSFSALQFVSAPLWGRLSDRIGRRPVILIGLAGSFASYVLFGVAAFDEMLALLFVSRAMRMAACRNIFSHALRQRRVTYPSREWRTTG